MIDQFKQIIANNGTHISKISLNTEFAQALYNSDTPLFGLVDSTFFGIPCVIRERQKAPFLITIQGGKK